MNRTEMRAWIALADCERHTLTKPLPVRFQVANRRQIPEITVQLADLPDDFPLAGAGGNLDDYNVNDEKCYNDSHNKLL
jgi:hypothetical protein